MYTSITQKPRSDCVQNPQNGTVEVYLRLADSKSLKIKLPTDNTIEQIRAKIQQLTNIEIENQILFYTGKELIDGMAVKLKQKAIIHIKNKKENNGNILIRVIQHHPQQKNVFKLNFQHNPILINPESTIEQLIQSLIQNTGQHIDYKRTKAIECGRFLKLSLTFSEQKIQSYTQIHLILRKKLKQNQFEKDNQQKLLIESVLKRSFDKQMNARQIKTDRVFGHQDDQQSRQNLGSRNNLNQETDERKQEDQGRRSLPNFLTSTKASEFWQSQKYIRKQITPLKFSFREYKKFEGPKSVRECNCKQKSESEQLCEHMIQGETPKNSSFPRDSLYKSSKKLKTRASMFF